MKNSEQPATGFGIPATEQNSAQEHIGLTKREHFAAMAMQGICSDLDYTNKRKHIAKEFAETIAQDALTIADTLLEALEVKYQKS